MYVHIFTSIDILSTGICSPLLDIVSFFYISRCRLLFSSCALSFVIFTHSALYLMHCIFNTNLFFSNFFSLYTLPYSM